MSCSGGHANRRQWGHNGRAPPFPIRRLGDESEVKRRPRAHEAIGSQAIAIFRGFASSTFGMRMDNTPSLNVASTPSDLTLLGRVNERENVP